MAAAMPTKDTALLLADLGVTKSPAGRYLQQNPFSASHFRQ
jgi:hypothetical protein